MTLFDKCHGSIKENRSKTYSKMYKEATRYWATKGLLGHGIGINAHDKELIDTFVIKSTLLNFLMQPENIWQGSIHVHPKAKVVYSHQNSVLTSRFLSEQLDKYV